MLSRSSSIRIQPFTGYRTPTRIRLSARVLRGSAPDFKGESVLDTLRTMAALYASREVEGSAVALHYAGEVLAHATSDAEGFVHFDTPFDGALPSQMRWEDAALHLEGEASEARVLAPPQQSAIGIISDIDDTIVETGITGSFRAIAKNLHRILLQSPQQRSPVAGAAQFFKQLTKAGGVHQRPCFYVSSSPWNLYPYLRSFKDQHGLPSGPMLLRDWSFGRETLGSAGHGTHKLSAILRLLSDFPAMRFVLIGDDTQRDLSAFGSIAAQHPDRIAAVFIRRAGADTNPDEAHARSILAANDTPFWTGEHFDDAHAALAQAGLE